MTKRDRIVLGIVVAVAVLGGFWMLVVKPANAELADLDEQLTQAEQQRDTAVADLASAKSAREQYQRDQTTLAVLGKAVPSDDGVPSLLYQLHKTARVSGIAFDSVNVGGGAGTATPAPAAPAPAPGTGPGAAGAANGAGAPGGAPAPGGQAAGATPAPGAPSAVAGAGGLTQLPLTIKFSGSFFDLERFLRRVHGFAKFDGEDLDVRGRLMTIDGIALSPAGEGKHGVIAEVTANAYVSPRAETPGSGATTASAGAAATAPPTTTSTTGATQ